MSATDAFLSNPMVLVFAVMAVIGLVALINWAQERSPLELLVYSVLIILAPVTVPIYLVQRVWRLWRQWHGASL